MVADVHSKGESALIGANRDYYYYEDGYLRGSYEDGYLRGGYEDGYLRGGRGGGRGL